MVEATSEKMVEAAVAEFGQVDAVFLNAGSAAQKPIVDLTDEDIDGIFASNFKSVVYGLKHVMKSMKEKSGGSIVVNTSCMGSMARNNFAGMSMYSASKAAADMAVKYAAVEGAPDKIRVNAVAPGVVATNLRPMGKGHARFHRKEQR